MHPPRRAPRGRRRRWREELSEGAVGWLGGTYGFTDDDEFIGVVRFESREAAMANSARPEQGAWAEKMMALMDGPVEFHDCDDVTLFMDGGSDDAGFVQIIRGKVDDPSRIKAMLADTVDAPRDAARDHRRHARARARRHVHRDRRVPRRGQRPRRASRWSRRPRCATELESMMAGARFYDLHHPWFESA